MGYFSGNKPVSEITVPEDARGLGAGEPRSRLSVALFGGIVIGDGDLLHVASTVGDGTARTLCDLSFVPVEATIVAGSFAVGFVECAVCYPLQDRKMPCP